MEQDDGKEERSQMGQDLPHPRGQASDIFASGGLSLEDFRQNELLKTLEQIAQSPDLPGGSSDLPQLERAARKNFRRHHEREKDQAANRIWQTVTDGNGRRGGGRDAWKRPMGDALPCDSAELFGQIRKENTRHPKRTSPNRPQTPLRLLIEQIVDEGLTVHFLMELARTMKARASQDAALIRHFAILVYEAGFDAETMKPVKEVDDDLMLKSGDNKRIAEQLAEFGFPTTVRDIENSKKRLDRSLLEVGARVLRQAQPTKRSKE
ncbi:MAG: hypothetical protein EKK41_27090 [Hyphomicrobiales bacterium]|nr:MAG: hypothetical protein EKK41_27090 [Hyphomicrobiales bacterium]